MVQAHKYTMAIAIKSKINTVVCPDLLFFLKKKGSYNIQQWSPVGNEPAVTEQSAIIKLHNSAHKRKKEKKTPYPYLL